jgi:acyl carrier protein
VVEQALKPQSGRKDFADSGPPVPNSGVGTRELVKDAQMENILRRNLVLVSDGRDVPLETELPVLGLDSMSALTLLLELEEIFGISFPDSLLSATTFRSARSLENVIQMLRKERDGHGRGH